MACSFLALSACSGTSAPAKKRLPPPLPTAKLTLLPETPMEHGRKVKVLMKLTDIKTHNLLTDADLQAARGEKIHLLVIDPTLSDYQHIHPKLAGTAGLYSFTFTPKFAGGYRIWADITPGATHRQEFPSAELGPHQEAKVHALVRSSAEAGGYHFALSFDKPPVAGGDSVGTILITHHGRAATVGSGGDMAYIAAFYENYRTAWNPQGMEGGGHDIRFHFAPDRAGFVKLFVQLDIGGKELTVPFGIVIPRVAKQP